MKVLVVLSALQTAAIVFLVVLLALEPEAAPAAGVGAPPGQSAATHEELLRKIIREELAAQLAHQETRGGAMPAAALAPPAATSNGERDQLAYVEKQLEYYRIQGTISHVEMQTLQGEIAKLDAVERKRMLSRLVKAMNAGEIRGVL